MLEVALILGAAALVWGAARLMSARPRGPVRKAAPGAAARTGAAVRAAPTVARHAPLHPPAPARPAQPVAMGGTPGRPAGQGTSLFGYGVRSAGPALGGHEHTGGYAALGIRTTGFSPASDCLAEIAVVRTTADGAPLDVWSSVFDTGRAPFPLRAVHGLNPEEAEGAPTFVDAVPTLMSLLGGCVVVAHHPEFVEDFLRGEFLRAGLLAPSMPAVSVSRLAQTHVAAHNHRLDTVAALLGTAHRPDGSAAAEAATVADLVPHLLVPQASGLVYPMPPLPVTPTPSGPPVGTPRRHPPATALDPWLSDLLHAMSISALEVHDPRAAAYVELLTGLLGRGHVVSEEVGHLTGSALRSGFSPAAVRAVHERFLELMRQAAFATTPELRPLHLRHLRAVAASLGLPTYFDDLIPPPAAPVPEPGSGSFSRPVRTPPPPPPPRHVPRCGRCLGVGHWTATCPRRPGGRIPPVTPIAPI